MTKRILHFAITVALLFSMRTSYSQIVFDIPEATGTYITGINIYTHICGYAVFADGTTRGFIKTAQDTIMLEYGGGDTWAGGINDVGEVVGRYNPSGLANDYHCFIYTLVSNTYMYMPQLDGYELLSPNDINNWGWISGDLKDAAQRRIFTYNAEDGMATNFVLTGGDVWPTYGGHDIDNFGRTSAFYIEGSVYKSAFYQNGVGFTEFLDLPDPTNPAIHKTRMMGGNDDIGLISFFGSRTAYTYNYVTGEVEQKLRIPGAVEVYAMDVNEDGYIAGYYVDSSYVTHGFFQVNTEISFLPSQDGFAFINDQWWCWNEDDYSGINYGVDPYWHDTHGDNIYFPGLSDTENYPSSSFDSWSDLVKACGESECYNVDPYVGYMEQDPNAYKIWKDNRSNEFGGICWGMVSNALLAYDNLSILETTYPSTAGLFTTNAPASLDSISYDQLVIPGARVSQVKQYSEVEWAQIQTGFQKKTIEVLPKIYEAISNNGEITSQLAIRLVGEAIHGCHAVMPYRMDRVPEDINQYQIHIYDPNEPMNDDRLILVDFNEDEAAYTYDFSGQYTEWAEYGLRVEESQPIFTEPFHIYHTDLETGTRDDDFMLTFPNRPDIHIEGGSGGSIDVQGNDFTESLMGAETIFRPTGLNEKPFRFRLSPLSFTATTNAINDKPFYASSQGNYGSVSYIRNGVAPGESDNVMNAGDVFSYINQGSTPVNINAEILTSEGVSTYQYFCDNIEVGAGQTISLQIIDPTHVLITSNGASTNYDVRIRIFSEETGFWETEAPGIPIGTDVTQILIPDLVDDMFNGITIETDADGDGIFEGTEDADNAGIPDMILSAAEFNIAAVSGMGEFNISNVGSGNLNWNFVETPSWITFTEGATGVNHGHVIFTAEDNTGLTRQGWLIAESAAPANDQDSVFVTQLGTNGVSDLDLGALVSMQPNPASDRVRFVKNGLLQGMPLAYEIFDARGSLVKKGSFTNTSETIETGEWQRGVYMVRFTSDSKTIVRKLVVS